MWIDEVIDALEVNKFFDINIEYLAFGASAIVSGSKETEPQAEAVENREMLGDLSSAGVMSAFEA